MYISLRPEAADGACDAALCTACRAPALTLAATPGAVPPAADGSSSSQHKFCAEDFTEEERNMMTAEQLMRDGFSREDALTRERRPKSEAV